LYLACSRAACAESVRQECLTRHTQLAGDIPSIVPLVTDTAGTPRVLVEVRIDGQLVTSRISGQAVQVDPGKHAITFSTDDGVFATREVFVAQGERNHPLHVVLHAAAPAAVPAKLEVGRKVEAPPKADTKTPKAEGKKGNEGLAMADDDGLSTPPRAPAPAPPRAAGPLDPHPGLEFEDDEPPREHRSPAGGLVLGALGLAGVGGFAVLTSWGRADNRMLATCSPSCPTASVQHVRRLYWAADASLGAGLVSLALSSWLLAGSF